MKKIISFKKTFSLIISIFYLSSFKFVLAMSQQTDTFIEASGFDSNVSDSTISNTLAAIIKVFLGFLGIIFIILVIWAGYNWMTAGGNEEKVTKARTTIFRAVIGLIIIVSAYAITHFVFGALE